MMHRFTNVLFSPLGDEDNAAAIDRVTELAARNGAKLTLLGVVPEPSRLHRLIHHADLDAAIESVHRHEMRERLEDYRDGADWIDIDVQAGNPAMVILGEVLTERHDLVVVTSDEDRQDRASIKRLMRKCPCPVWVIRPTQTRTQQILVPVDPEPAAVELNKTLLQLAAGMFDLYGGELHLLHAWQLFGESTMRDESFPSVSGERVDELMQIEQEGRLRALDELVAASGVADRPWQIHLVKGPPILVVPEFVTSTQIDLLVMGTIARAGLSGVVMGNTAELVLDMVRCSTIAIKPPGFLSPLAARR